MPSRNSPDASASPASRAGERLGPHTTGVGCIYVKDLTTVDLDVLETIVSRSYAALTAAASTLRAREGGKP